MTPKTQTFSFALVMGVSFLLPLLDPTDLLAAATLPAMGTEPTPVLPGTPVLVRFRNMTYASGRPVDDDEKYVEGGADGSSILLIRNRYNKSSQWVFLHGKHMFLRVVGDPASTEVITSTPGEFITSEAGDWDKSKKAEYSKRKLTNHLQLFYGAHGILHVPFLKGNGWHDNVGATWSETEPILKEMNLNSKVMSANNKGRVIAQVPVGGMPVLPGTTVMLWFDGKRSVKVDPAGDTHGTAIGVVDHGNDLREEVSAEITRNHTHTIADTSCTDGDKNIFWELPKSARGQRMKATIVSLGPRATLSAWELNPTTGKLQAVRFGGKADCCAFGRRPSIEFDVHPEWASFIVVDVGRQHVEKHAEWFTVYLEWAPPQGQQKPEQEQQQAQQNSE